MSISQPASKPAPRPPPPPRSRSPPLRRPWLLPPAGPDRPQRPLACAPPGAGPARFRGRDWTQARERQASRVRDRAAIATIAQDRRRRSWMIVRLYQWVARETPLGCARPATESQDRQRSPPMRRRWRKRSRESILSRRNFQRRESGPNEISWLRSFFCSPHWPAAFVSPDLASFNLTLSPAVIWLLRFTATLSPTARPE